MPLKAFLDDHNRRATGRHDGQGLGFVIRTRRDAQSVLLLWLSRRASPKRCWVDEACRGRGYARALLDAFAAEAASRGVRRIWVASYDFQAPAMYEKAGFKRMAEFAGWPEGHTNVILCKTLIERQGSS